MPAGLPAVPAQAGLPALRAPAVVDRRVIQPAKGRPFVAVPRKAQRRGKTVIAILFAVIAVLLACGTIALYATRSRPSATPTASASASEGSPDGAVREFLSAVFLSDSVQRLIPVVCANWPPADALTRTKSMVSPMAKVSWDGLNIVSNEPNRVTMTARLGLRLPDDVQPSQFQQWDFTVVNEHGWRVCDASAAVS
jgi:hypothetical protein